MNTKQPGKRRGLLYFLLHPLFFKRKQNTVPAELQSAIDESTTVEQLKELLFIAGFLDENKVKAFDKRFDELESKG